MLKGEMDVTVFAHAALGEEDIEIVVVLERGEI